LSAKLSIPMSERFSRKSRGSKEAHGLQFSYVTMNLLVSILIPAHNAENWIADTIRSAITQTWVRKEIIVVDDGSSDRTADVARRFASKEVVVISKKNQGAAAARNHALQFCQGDYIQWLDADDILAPDKIERQLTAL
jgi:glycosyltransferase involved in cell wall biosynthesis